MFRNYLNVIFRNIIKRKLYTTINVLGLSIGIASFMLLLLYVKHEFGYDQFHNRVKDIYRVNVTDISELGEDKYAHITAAIVPDMATEYPEIENFVRFSAPTSGYLSFNNKTFQENNITYADSSLFDVFSFGLLQGNPSKALAAPNSIILTESLANKIFGPDEAIGKSVLFNNEDRLTVTGVIEDFRADSHLQFSALISFSSLYNKKIYLDWNGGWNYLSYILLNKNVDVKQLESKFDGLFDRKINHLLQDVVRYEASLERLSDIHLYTEVLHPLATKGNALDVYIFLSIAMIILFLACINFINLAIAQMSKRVKEIGVRKVVGASRLALIHQFMLESTLIAMASFLIALELVSTFQSAFAELLGTSFDIWELSGFQIVGLGCVIVIVVGIVSGGYPALYLSGFKPIQIMKKKFYGGGTFKMSKGLLSFQFVISVTLVISTLVIYNQLEYIKNKELGYENENIITIPLTSLEAKRNFQALKKVINSLPEVVGVGASSQLPGKGYTSNGYFVEGSEAPFMFNALDIDPDYFKAMSLEVIKGRNFSDAIQSDSNAYIVNQALVDKMGWSKPLGKLIERNGKHEVIGVVENYHFSTLHETINPLIISLRPFVGYNYLSVKIEGNNLGEILKKLEIQWHAILPKEAFLYNFLDQTVEVIYYKEQAFKSLFVFFSILAIVIAILGLLGLVSYSVHSRTKEVGIRKILGASVTSILFLLSREFLFLLLIASLLGWPIAYFGMEFWLNSFSYRIGFPYINFIFSTALFFLLILVIVIVRSFNSANANPIEYIRND
ncbi:MAG: ABC transporter permease [Bacteroidota bacterium]